MQPVNTSNIHNQLTTKLQNKPYEIHQKPATTAVNATSGKALKLPVDIVNLSTSPILKQCSSEIKKPSMPVSNTEKEALLQSFSDKINISKYV